MGKLSDWHQLWYTSADSSGNGHMLNTIRPTIPHGHLGGGLAGHTFKCLGKLSNGWTDRHQMWYKSADSSRKRHMLNTIRPSIPQGVIGGDKFQSLGKLSNSWIDWHKIWHTCRFIWEWIHAKKTALRYTRGHLGGLGGQTFKSLEKLSNGWTDWHQVWFTSAVSSRNGHRLNISRPTILQGEFWGVLGGHQFKCHQKWYMSADSSGNGHS